MAGINEPGDAPGLDVGAGEAEAAKWNGDPYGVALVRDAALGAPEDVVAVVVALALVAGGVGLDAERVHVKIEDMLAVVKRVEENGNLIVAQISSRLDMRARSVCLSSLQIKMAYKLSSS